ncbi:cytochrome P450 [Hygrophoropsis aurantiaca]|uniref:Cytochrome P450 n=1 Tax=Hygrophoropsis aurantiaca TaxID=72124 RepID=A0ACB8ATQ8_9AGAM|nr:cytochrome P450 [Hygrophoropsis aurantiaca]
MTAFLSIILSGLFALLLVTWLTKKRRSISVRLPLPPGPKPLPVLGNLLDINRSEPWLTFTQWGSHYGDIVYCRLLNREIIIIQSESVAKTLLERRSSNYSDRPRISTSEAFGSAFISAQLGYGSIWRLHRRLFHQSFRMDAIHQYRPLQLRKARQLCLEIRDTPADLLSLLQTFSASLIMSAVYDYEAAPRHDPLISTAEKAIDGFIKAAAPHTAAILNAFPFLLRLPDWVPGTSIKRLALQSQKCAIEMIEVPFQYAQERITKGVSAKCMVADSLNRLEGQGDKNQQEVALKASAATAFIAGVETTTSTLTVFALAMINYPHVQERVQAEIDAVIGSDRLPSFEDRASLPYLEAVLRETLRWNPVFPVGLPHATTHDDIYDGYYIPKGAYVIANVWAMTHNETKYPDPYDFRPERFLTADGGLTDDTATYGFGFGRRACVGRYFASSSLWIAMASMLANFKFMKPVDEHGNETEVNAEWTTGIMSHPTSLSCRIVARFNHAREDMTES